MVKYADGLELQKQLVEERKADRIPDQLLLLEHPPVITLGVRTRDDRSHVLATPEALERDGIELFETGRGGDVTFHGPGQLVGYPIIDLRPDRQRRAPLRARSRRSHDPHGRRLRRSGDASARTDRRLGGHGRAGEPPRWEKLAAIGVRISRWVTSHGFAFNVTTNLDHFGLIVPCGIADKGVTSLGRLVGRAVPMAEVEGAAVAAMADVFGRIALETAANGPTTRH